MDKSLEQQFYAKNITEAMREFTKAVFKFSFYFCIFSDKSYRLTSICDIQKKILELGKNKQFDEIGYHFLKESIYFRTNNEFREEFKDLLSKFIEYIFNLLGDGKLHKKMKYEELKKYLNQYFGGFSNLIQVLEKAKKSYLKQRFRLAKATNSLAKLPFHLSFLSILELFNYIVYIIFHIYRKISNLANY